VNSYAPSTDSATASMDVSAASTSLLTDMYELTMLQGALASGAASRRSVFELFGRRLPGSRRFGVVAGTDRLRDAIEAAIPLSPGNYNKDWILPGSADDRCRELAKLAEETDVDLSHSPKWRQQLGSLGGGNHFIELCLDETDTVWMFLHSGSRGVGNKIAQKHIAIAKKLMAKWWIPIENNDLAYLVQGTPEFGSYIKDLHWAQRFAFLNREEMMDRFSTCLSEFMGTDVEEVERINCHHNYTQREEHAGHTVWLTRKGAVNADEGRLALIPGSMGTASYVVEGKGNIQSLHSAPHGAGRRYSRTEARRRFTVEDLASRMTGIVYRPGAAGSGAVRSPSTSAPASATPGTRSRTRRGSTGPSRVRRREPPSIPTTSAMP